MSSGWGLTQHIRRDDQVVEMVECSDTPPRVVCADVPLATVEKVAKTRWWRLHLRRVARHLPDACSMVLSCFVRPC